jgi:hypothetical protein
MLKRTGFVMAAALALIAASIVLRREPEPEAPVRAPGSATTRAAVEPAEPIAVIAPARADPEVPFWDRVGSLLEARPSLGPEDHRTAVLKETAGYLGLDRSQAQVFESVARQAIQEIEESWRVREAGWLALSANLGLDGALREQAEREVQERYEDRKGQALARIDSVIGSGPRAALLRDRLPEWMDAVR